MATFINDRYMLKKRDIGSGNMSSIHLCIDTDLDDDNYVIIKMFDKINDGDEDLQKKIFNREVESLNKLKHKNIVQILDSGYDGGFNAFYIVLEYIHGEILKIYVMKFMDMIFFKK